MVSQLVPVDCSSHPAWILVPCAACGMYKFGYVKEKDPTGAVALFPATVRIWCSVLEPLLEDAPLSGRRTKMLLRAEHDTPLYDSTRAIERDWMFHIWHRVPQIIWKKMATCRLGCPFSGRCFDQGSTGFPSARIAFDAFFMARPVTEFFRCLPPCDIHIWTPALSRLVIDYL